MPIDEIVHVDSFMGADEPIGTGEPGKPLKSIQAAIRKNKRWVLVEPRTSTYSAVDITFGEVTLVSPRPSPWEPVDNGNPAALVTSNKVGPGVKISGGAKVMLDGFTIYGSAPGIYCEGGVPGTEVTVLRSYIANNGDMLNKTPGLLASDCTVTIKASRIGPMNSGGGVVLQGFKNSTYEIVNNFVFDNQGTGVVLGENYDGDFLFNTIAGNTAPSSLVGGVSCSGQQTIRWCLLWGNEGRQPYQLGPVKDVSCLDHGTADALVVGGAQGQQDGGVDWPFVSIGGYSNCHLNSPDCCTRLSVPAKAPPNDIDGEPRGVPNGEYDIGADQFKKARR